MSIISREFLCSWRNHLPGAASSLFKRVDNEQSESSHDRHWFQVRAKLEMVKWHAGQCKSKCCLYTKCWSIEGFLDCKWLSDMPRYAFRCRWIFECARGFLNLLDLFSLLLSFLPGPHEWPHSTVPRNVLCCPNGALRESVHYESSSCRHFPSRLSLHR